MRRPKEANESVETHTQYVEETAYQQEEMHVADLFTQIGILQPAAVVVISGRQLKKAVNVLQEYNIQAEDVLNTSATSLYRAYKKDDIDLDYKDRLAIIFQIIEKGIDAFDDVADFKQWLVTPVPTLGATKPVELLRFETGRREVEKAINRVEYNLYG